MQQWNTYTEYWGMAKVTLITTEGGSHEFTGTNDSIREIVDLYESSKGHGGPNALQLSPEEGGKPFVLSISMIRELIPEYD